MTPSNINWHNISMVAMLSITTIVGFLTLLQGIIPLPAGIVTVLGILTLIEHTINGNTNTPTS